MNRCDWCLSSPLYISYHDEEWGVPIYQDRLHFECLVLELMQSGLSFLTILKKRQTIKKAFASYDLTILTQFDDTKINELMQDSGIIRHKNKIEAVITNAKCFIQIQQEFGSFNDYIWQFVNKSPIEHHPQTLSDVPNKTILSDQISKDLKKRGFKFLGSTTIYAYLQAAGLVNDHVEYCFKNKGDLIRDEKD